MSKAPLETAAVITKHEATAVGLRRNAASAARVKG
jgi:hypothetical protein